MLLVLPHRAIDDTMHDARNEKEKYFSCPTHQPHSAEICCDKVTAADTICFTGSSFNELSDGVFEVISDSLLVTRLDLQHWQSLVDRLLPSASVKFSGNLQITDACNCKQLPSDPTTST